MTETNPYIQLLKESLQKKIQVLDEIIKKNQNQMEVLSKEEVSFDDFDLSVVEKDDLIHQLNSLDDGFEGIYSRVREELQKNREKYTDDIKEMQKMISMITDRSVTIQTMESRNKKKIEDYFRNTRKGMRQARHVNQVANNYYRNMMNTTMNPPSELDKKK